MKIGLLGYGVVGVGVQKIANACPELEVKRILCKEIQDGGLFAYDYSEIVNDPEIGAVVEAMGGVHPAREFVLQALQAGKHVVTPNKALMAACGPELVAAAAEHGVCIRCTASVGGGIPWLRTLANACRLDEVKAFGGIFNGTTNFILSAMEQSGASFEGALQEAQKLGYAEKDPTADIDGWDVRRKVAVSAGVAFGLSPEEQSVPMEGIRSVTAQDMEAFRAMGCTCRLLGHAAKTPEGVSAWVEPTLVKLGSMEAAVEKNNNLITMDAELLGVQSFYGQGAGRFPTAANVVEDLLELTKPAPVYYRDGLRAGQAVCTDVHPYYVRTDAPDAWLEANTEKETDSYVLTKPVPVTQMHAWLQEQRLAGAQVFAAGLKGEKEC